MHSYGDPIRRRSFSRDFGETASGKSALAIELAKQFNGEIIAADSRTVYRGMDIGTAKPTLEEQHLVPHHLIDVVNPDERFTVADFKHLTEITIRDITSRGKLPILVGGSGLYIDAVLFDFAFSGQKLTEGREALRQLSIEELQAKLKKQAYLCRITNAIRDILSANSRQVVSAASQCCHFVPNTLVLGMEIDREVLAPRIAKRVEEMFNART